MSAGISGCVLYKDQMSEETNNVPDGISPQALKDMMKEAIPEAKYESDKENSPYDGLTKKQMLKLATNTLRDAHKECSDVVFTKVLILKALGGMIEYHEAIAREMAKEGKSKQSVAWAGDMGFLQSAHNLLRHVYLGDEDFICPE